MNRELSEGSDEIKQLFFQRFPPQSYSRQVEIFIVPSGDLQTAASPSHSPWDSCDPMCPASPIVLRKVAVGVTESNNELFTEKFDMEFYYLLIMCELLFVFFNGHVQLRIL